MVTILFSKRVHPGSWLIRMATWSEWSHVELVLPDGRLLGAAAPHGVQYDTMENRLRIASEVALMQLPGNEEAVLAWATQQIGRPYDWLGVAGLGFHRNWEEDDAWFCSEFVGRALKEGGYEPYRADVLRRLVPQHLWMLNQPTKTLK